MRRSAIGTLVFFLALAACSAAADSAATSSSVATSTPATTTTAGASTTSSSSSLITTSTSTTTTSTLPPTTTVPALTCPLGPAIPADAADLTEVAVDLNVDGQLDSLQTYAVPSEDRWHIRVEFGGGGAFDEAIEGSNLVAPARPIGAVDLEEDGTMEAFAVVGSGAAVLLIGLYDVDGCAITRITIGGSPAVFPVGATVGSVSGLSCEGVGDLDRLFASRIGADAFEGGFEPFALVGAVLTPGFGDGAGFTDAEAAALATFDCAGLTLP